MKYRRLIFITAMLLMSLTLWAGLERVPHLTPAESTIQSEIVMNNDSLNPAKVTLHTTDGIRDYTVPAQTTLTLTPADLGPLWPTHLTYEVTQDLVTVSARYVSKEGDHYITVPGSDQVARRWRFSQLGMTRFWGGVALVNAGAGPTDVVIRQYDGQRNLLYEKTMLEGLASGQKSIFLLNALPMTHSRDTYFELISDNPVSALVLYGNDPKMPDAFVSFIQPERVFQDHIKAIVSGGFIGIHEEVLIQNGMLTFQGVTVPMPSEEAFYAELEALGINSLRLPASRFDCCDQFDYTASVVRGETGNAFSFNDWDRNREEMESAFAIVTRIFELAVELTGKPSIPFGSTTDQ